MTSKKRDRRTTSVQMRAVGFTPKSELKHYLEVRDDQGRRERIALTDGELLIGRSAQCALQLDFKNVSRIHARLYREDDEFYLEDLESTNGVFVNGVKVARCVMRNSDVIEIGSTRIMFVEISTTIRGDGIRVDGESSSGETPDGAEEPSIDDDDT